MTGIELIDHWLGFVAMLAVAVALLIALRRILRLGEGKNPEAEFRNKLVMLGVSVIALVALLVAAPFEPTTRGQLLGLVGLMISAAIALSSTTILGNAMAGLMQRAVGNFKVGDFVRTEGHFGRVSERGLFHTEIQTEQRDLVTLPNLFLATHAVTVIRKSGTIVTADVSLGYDSSHAVIEPLLLAAATAAGLQEPFVQILELGDFTVVYRVSGLLTDVSRLLTVRSRLRSAMLDELHGGGIEIASPTLMSTRAFPPDHVIVPSPVAAKPVTESDAVPEAVAFDKADEAATLASLQEMHAKLEERITAAGKAIKEAADDQARAAAQADRDILERRRDALAETIARRDAEKCEGSD